MLESQTDFFKRKHKGFYMVYTVSEKSGKTKKIQGQGAKNLLKAGDFCSYSIVELVQPIIPNVF